MTLDRLSDLAGRILRLELRALVTIALAGGLVLASAPITAPITRAAEPRVVIVVGPVGSLTARYIAAAEGAADEARRHTGDVTTIYSPDATWPAVRAALQGASVVMYLGHGNGFPSRYTKALRPEVQNGFGLNPAAGVGDAHKYFGESHIARDVRLAPNAIVLLHRLCYASGNSEPGLPEGSLEVGKARVDNFAAGFIAAGASAVLADTFANPAWYVRQLLTGSRTVESMWRAAPTSHGNVLAFPSRRSPGLTALMDPTDGTSGRHRSLVTKAELRTDEMRRGASLTVDIPAVDPGPPVGPAVASLSLEGPPTAGTDVALALTFDGPASPTSGLGLGVRWDAVEIDPASLRWRPVEVSTAGPEETSPSASIEAPGAPAVGSPVSADDGAASGPEPTDDEEGAAAAGEVDASAPPAASEPTPVIPPAPSGDPAADQVQPDRPDPSADADPADRSATTPTAPPDASPAPPDASPAPSPTAPPDASPAPSPTIAPAATTQPATGPSPLAASSTDPAPGSSPPEIILIAAEVPGEVVRVTPTSPTPDGLLARIRTPDAPGRYRLVVTLYDPDGVAFAPVTQERIPVLVVRVTGTLSATIAAPERVDVLAGATTSIPVAVLNSGTVPWYEPLPSGDPDAILARLADGSSRARLVGHWVPLLVGLDVELPAGPDVELVASPGLETRLEVGLAAPGATGDYLLVLDIVTPIHGSLTTHGTEPAIVRVHVEAMTTSVISLD
jgi:hypothetical protein